MQIAAPRFMHLNYFQPIINQYTPVSTKLTFGHDEVSLTSRLKHGAFHVGVCTIASVVGHNFFGDTAHNIADYLSQAPWFESISQGFSTIGHWITPETSHHVCEHGSSGDSSVANTTAHIAVECVGPTAALEAGLILASELKKKTTSLLRWLWPKKSN